MDIDRKNLPSAQDWEKLYSLAAKFKKIAPWDWMYDSDLFGVQDPESGETNYCCVMGRLGEVFALNVYLGPEGLEGYLKIASGKISGDDYAVLRLQNCIMLSFENKNYLDKNDIQLMRNTEINFQGKKSYPQFRRYQPGFIPWYLTKEEADILILAIEQAINVCLRLENNEDLLISPRQGLIFTRVSSRDKSGIKWEDRWISPAPYFKKQEYFSMNENEEILIQRIKEKKLAKNDIWEIDFSYFHTAVQNKKDQRPYFPQNLLIVDQSSQFIIGGGIAESDKYAREFREILLSSALKIGFIPKEIWIKNNDVANLFQPITDKLEIKLKMVKNLKIINRVRKDMEKFSGGLC